MVRATKLHPLLKLPGRQSSPAGCYGSSTLADAVMPVAGRLFVLLLFKTRQSLIFPPRFWGYLWRLPSYWVRLRSLDASLLGSLNSVAVSNLPLGGYWSDWTDKAARGFNSHATNFPLFGQLTSVLTRLASSSVAPPF